MLEYVYIHQLYVLISVEGNIMKILVKEGPGTH